MLVWLQWHWARFCSILSAPILYHAARDGYVMNIYHTTFEMVDAYGTLVLAFVFISAVVYYRNSLFRVFLYSRALSTKAGRQTVWYYSSLHFKDLSNRSKFLNTIVVSYGGLKLLISPLFKSFKEFLRK